MRKRVISILLCALMLSTLAFPALAIETQSDLTCSEGFVIPADDGEVLEELIDEFADIEPLNLIGNATRAEAVHMMVQAAAPADLVSSNTPNITGRFSDVSPQHWFFPAVAWASNRGWVNGYADGTFRPHNTISRQEFVVMLVRARGAGPGTINLTFADTNQIGNWALPYVRRAVQNGWVQGFPDNTFRPNAAFTRNDALTFVRRINSAVVYPNNIRTIHWNTQIGFIPASWQRINGNALGQPLPTPFWISDYTFRGWNSTDGWTARGVAVTASTIPTGNVTYHARWHEPRRHRDYWYRSSTVTLRTSPVNLGTTWQSALEDAARNWTNSATPITVRLDQGSPNLATTQFRSSENPSTLGSFRRHSRSGTELRQFEIRLYTQRIPEHVSANPGFEFHRVATSVWAHEIGHAVGLADDPNWNDRNSSIMNVNRCRDSVLHPTPFDRQSVNWLYR